MAHAHPLSTIILVLTFCLALTWLYKATRAFFGIRGLPDLNQVDFSVLPPLSAGSEPHLTVIVPACNEEQAIESSLASLLAQREIRLQIIAVDDRSTDETGTRMESAAARCSGSPHTLEIIRNRALPPAWLGKPHAVSLGVARGAAPWILLTDADVHFAPECLSRALRLAEARRADHLVLLPTLIRSNWRESAMVAVFQVITHWSMRLWKVEDPKARDFLGVGGFNMVRASALQAIGGIEKVRLEVVEDMSIGWLVKRHGFHSCVALGPGQASIRWFEGAFGMVANLEKNGFAAFRFQPPQVLVALTVMGLQIVLPFAALFCGWLGVGATAAMYIGLVIGYCANRKVNAASPVLALAYAPALALLCWAFLRSTILTLKRGGVSWRGTFYPLSELKSGMIKWRAW
jgi:glycosyltransferase involved in cell wall biosynthesis